MSGNYLLISVHSKHAERIFQGEKTVELRKMRPRVAHGDVVLVYVSAPNKSLEGSFVVQGIVEGEPQHLWEEFGPEAGLTEEEFNNYSARTRRGVGIIVQDVQKFCRAVPLTTLRKKMRGFKPPQTYRYISRRELNNLGVAAESSESSVGIRGG